MTIRQLYEWAQQHNYLDLPIVISSYNREGIWIGDNALCRESITVEGGDYVMLNQEVKWE